MSKVVAGWWGVECGVPAGLGQDFLTNAAINGRSSTVARSRFTIQKQHFLAG